MMTGQGTVLRGPRRWLVRHAALLALAAGGVAACGGDDAGNAGGGPSFAGNSGSGGSGAGTGGSSGGSGGSGISGSGGSGISGSAGSSSAGTSSAGASGSGGPFCGNGVIDGAEECDGTADCDVDCTLIPPDEDADGISDADEGRDESVDSDKDGTPDWQDADSDNDGIPDAVEAGEDDLRTPPRNSDKDSTPDFQDPDSDDDGFRDEAEAGTDPTNPADTDGDYTPDYVDRDSDNDDLPDVNELGAGTDPRNPDSDADGISDGDDGIKDPDGDGRINALDDDSDGDGVPDAEEAGDLDWRTLPDDTDLDGIADFLDLDSEQDGLPDGQEAVCTGLGKNGRFFVDTDEDGFQDLAEVLIGSNPCDPSQGVTDVGVDFFFVLPYLDPEQSDILRFDPKVNKADVFFNVDTTGSMGDVIANLKAGLGTVVSNTQARVTDSAFGVGFFNDPNFGTLQAVTTNVGAAQSAVNSLSAVGGGDEPEQGFTSLTQLAGGAAGFRAGALPIIVHATDATSKGSLATAVSALQGIGARVITVHSSSFGGSFSAAAGNQLTDLSRQTGAQVPVCAYKVDATNWQCGVNTCCGGSVASGGNCVLRYQTNSNVSSAASDGIDALVKYATFDVYSRPRDDGDGATPDTAAFLTRIEANTPDDSFKPPLEPEFSCNPVPTPATFQGAGYNNGFAGFAVGTSRTDREGAKLFFRVVARNTTVPETSIPQLFEAFIDIVDVTTSAVLDSQKVVIIVPAAATGASE